MTPLMIKVLLIFLVLIIGFGFAQQLHTTMGTVGLIVIGLLLVTGGLDAKSVLANFGNANIILIFSMFVVIAGFNRTQAVNKMAGLVNKVSGGSFTKQFAGYILVGSLLSQFIPSPMAVYLIMCPLVASMCAECGVSPSKAMFPLALAIIATCGTLPIGNGSTTFATTNVYLESYGYTDYQMGILDTFNGRWPVMVVILLYCIFIAPKFCPAQPTIAIKELEDKKKGNAKPQLDPLHETLGYLIFALTTLGLILQTKLGMPAWEIALLGAIVTVATRVLQPKEAIAALPVHMLPLIVATLSMGTAMINSGLGDVIGGWLGGVIANIKSPVLIGAIFFIIPFILTQFMNNGGCSNIFRPIAVLTCKALAANPIGPLILLDAACLNAFLTPMATIAIPVVMETGGYDQKDLLKMGWLPALLITVISVIWISIRFPL